MSVDIDPVAVAGANFRCDDATDRLADDKIKKQFGFDGRFVAARLAVASALVVEIG
jgi:hypothetical protein